MRVWAPIQNTGIPSVFGYVRSGINIKYDSINHKRKGAPSLLDYLCLLGPLQEPRTETGGDVLRHQTLVGFLGDRGHQLYYRLFTSYASY